MKTNGMLLKSAAGAALLLSADVMLSLPAMAQIDEIVVTARKREESLQDVPVTVQALGAAKIDQYQIDSIREIQSLVPAFKLTTEGGSGAGGSLALRGIGSSPISAAFDTAVAFNIEGVTANTSKFLQQNTLDLAQIEILKGPQSLYFGKSASAGVLSMRSADPGDEFEGKAKASYEFEEGGKIVEGVISGPITNTLGARIAVRGFANEQVVENTSPAGTIGSPTGALAGYLVGPGDNIPNDRTRDESSVDWRVTLNWQPTDTFSANLKYFHSNWKHDGQIYAQQAHCVVPDSPQLTAYPLGGPVSSGYDCNSLDRVVQLGDQNTVERQSIPGNNGGIPFYDQRIITTRLKMDWDVTDALTLTSVSGLFGLNDHSLDFYGYDANGIGGNTAFNGRTNYSQELRLASDWDGMFNFLFGSYYQHRRIQFYSYQHAVGISTANTAVLPFPLTSPLIPDDDGLTADWYKQHTTDTDAISIFGNLQFNPIESVELVAGLRWSRERHQNDIFFPHIHDANIAFGFAAFNDGGGVKGIEFQDENLSPEASIAWQATDSTNLYAAFKTGFKSGGIDNSALPSAGLNPLTNPTFAEDLVFGSETAMGFEVGAKNDFTFGDNTVRANLTFYRYVYEDLQVQLFNTSQLAFVTTNASELTNKGVELESIWETPLDGLSINLNFAWVDTVLTKDFFVDGGEGIYNCAPVALGGSTLCDLSLPDTNGNGTREANLKGTRAVGVGKYNGNFGFDFARPLGSLPLAIVAGSNHQFESKFDTNVGDWSDYYQDFYFKHDAYFGMGDADGRWQLSVVGTNLADKITVNGSGGRPFTVSQGQAGNPREELDQVLSFSRGRQVTLEGSINF